MSCKTIYVKIMLNDAIEMVSQEIKVGIDREAIDLLWKSANTPDLLTDEERGMLETVERSLIESGTPAYCAKTKKLVQVCLCDGCAGYWEEACKIREGLE